MAWTYENFKSSVFELATVNLSLYKERQMKRRIDALISRGGFASYEEYFKKITDDKVEFQRFIEYLTINVSEFYRNPEQWDILEKIILPNLIAYKKDLRIWSAACSTGEEPYSLAMLLSNFYPLSSLKILATDLDKAAISKAKIGVYGQKSLETLPQKYIDQYFTKSGADYAISNSIKDCIEFKQHDMLLEPFPGVFDLILCRNVMIYFTEEAKSELYLKFQKALDKNSVLFVGSTEQIIFPHKFGLKSLKTYFYVRNDL